MKPTSIASLIEAYDGFLVDAYGVLVDGSGALPGATSFIKELEATAKSWLVITNDASRSPRTCAERYRRLGVPVSEGSVLTSGSLLVDHFADPRWQGRTVAALGTEDSFAYLREAGLRPVLPSDEAARSAEALIVGDAGGFDFIEETDAALTLALARREAGLTFELVVPNPDLIYPKGAARAGRPAEYGFAAGTVARMIESGLELRFPGDPANRFLRLGKPEPALFERGLTILGTRRTVMVGDQIATDIAGARRVGIDAALVGIQAQELLRGSRPTRATSVRPSWLIPSLAS